MPLDLATISEAELKQLSPTELQVLLWFARWKATARPKQIPPRFDKNGVEVDEIGVLSGRGFGKSLMGAQWLASEAYLDPEAFDSQVIAPTLSDVRQTCFEGPVGLLSILPPDIVTDYNKTNLIIRIRTQSGKESIIRGFSAEEPERLRGAQFARSWRDEVAAWSMGSQNQRGLDQDTWDMANMGLRQGRLPKKLWTTTPKPRDLIRSLITPLPGRVIITGTTYENRANLPDSFFRQLQQYEGTQLGRQELEGELIDSEEGGIISRSWIRLWPSGMAIPRLEWIILSLDTAFTEKTLDRKTHNADPTAGGCFGVFFQEETVEGKPTMRANVLLLDCWAEHLGFPALVEKVKREMKVRYGDDHDKAIIRPKFGSAKPRTSGRPPDILLIEDKGSGISLRQALYREKIESYPYNPGRADKTARLHIVSHIFAAKRFWVPESENKPGRPKSWVEPMLAQLCSFQGEGSIKHDDYIDVCSQALRLLMDKNLLTDMLKPRKGAEDLDAIARRRPRSNPYAA